MTTDPRIRELASEAARKIKVLTNERNEGIQGIYRDYQQKAAIIRAESSADGIAQTPALPSEPSPQRKTQ